MQRQHPKYCYYQKHYEVFELTSGLRVNLAKSSIGGLGANQVSLERYVIILNYKITSFPLVYLGVPIGGNQNRTSFRKVILDKVKKKLSSSKGRLINNVSLLFIIKVPKSVNK